MNKQINFLLFLFLFASPSVATNLDSLLRIREKQSGAEKIKTLNKISVEYRKSDLKKSRAYAQLALSEAQQMNDTKGVGDALNNLGNVLNFEGDYEGAIDYFLRSFLFRQKIADSSGMANCLSNIGVMYRKMNNYEKAFGYYQKSLFLKEKLNKPAEVLMSLNNIGGLFYYERNFKKAHEYYEKALGLSRKLSDSVYMGAAYNNLGIVLSDEKKFAKALEYFDHALRIRERLADEPGIAVVTNNIGRVYEAQGINDKAFAFYKRAARLYQEENDMPNYANSLYNMGSIQLSEKNYKAAIAYFHESEKLSEQFSNRLQLRDLHNRLGIAYHYLGKDRESYTHLMKYIDLNDSIFDEATLEKISEKEIKYQSEKKQKENEILKQQNELKDLLHERSEQKQRMVRIYFISGLVIALSVALLFFVRFRSKKKSEQQLTLYNTEILKQKSIVDEKNKEITDSIIYAQKIQAAILPSINRFENILPGSFVFFKPKDIVSGDFYWMSEKENCIFFAAVDCTGHGVPGGFMSMLGSSLLHEIINEKNVFDPADVLDLMRIKIIQALRQTGASGENKDGMDMALCRYDLKENKIVYAGANNDLVFIRNKKFSIYKATGQPIGFTFGTPTHFNQQEIMLEAGDSVFIYTDGYADQFGGPKGKKFKYRQLNELLATISDSDPATKRNALEQTFTGWIGDLEQVDDVLVIGFTS
jgi:serine phosphatase RsbU (regulator of sigma subunit)/Tfp pilus assembly protein PilF